VEIVTTGVPHQVKNTRRKSSMPEKESPHERVLKRGKDVPGNLGARWKEGSGGGSYMLPRSFKLKEGM